MLFRSYMTLPEYQNTRWPLPDTASFCTGAEKTAPAVTPEDASVAAMRAQLAQRFNSR